MYIKQWYLQCEMDYCVYFYYEGTKIFWSDMSDHVRTLFQALQICSLLLMIPGILSDGLECNGDPSSSSSSSVGSTGANSVG